MCCDVQSVSKVVDSKVCSERNTEEEMYKYATFKTSWKKGAFYVHIIKNSTMYITTHTKKVGNTNSWNLVLVYVTFQQSCKNKRVDFSRVKKQNTPCPPSEISETQSKQTMAARSQWSDFVLHRDYYSLNQILSWAKWRRNQVHLSLQDLGWSTAISTILCSICSSTSSHHHQVASCNQLTCQSLTFSLPPNLPQGSTVYKNENTFLERRQNEDMKRYHNIW